LSPSNSGSFNFGKAIPVKWQLKQGGVFVRDLNTLSALEAVPGTASPANSMCVPNGGPSIQLLDSATGRPTGNSTYRYDTTNNQFIFNWDTSAASKSSCYRLRLSVADASTPKVTLIQFK
jgi:hypothetical protein